MATKQPGTNWKRETAIAVQALRAAYLAEVARFAEELRPRFTSGEVRGFLEEDGDSTGPADALRYLCGRHFAMKDMAWEEMHAVLAVSPSAEEVDDAWCEPWHHLREAVAYDVIRIARARGWYAPASDEEPADDRVTGGMVEVRP